MVLVFFFFNAMPISAAKPMARMTPQREMRTMGRVSSMIADYWNFIAGCQCCSGSRIEKRLPAGGSFEKQEMRSEE